MRRLAVLGHPVGHSRSPAMQNAALHALGLGVDWLYEAIEVSREDFADRVRSMPGEGFVGANVTIPHKEAALALADPSPAAEEIGAANTLSFSGGKVIADNTDAPGLIAALGGFDPGGKRALVLGAGGSARAAVWALAARGTAVEVWNRTAERAEALAADLADSGSSLEAVETKRALEGGHDLVVNCTAVGMRGEDPFEELPVAPEVLGPDLTFVDLVYAGGETKLAAAARASGATVIDGLEVLVRQGAASLGIWLGHEREGDEVGVDVLEVMREAATAG